MCNGHHQLIMKLERVRNHDAHFTYTLELLSIVLHTFCSILVTGMCCANIRPALKPLVTMDSVSHVMIPSLVCLVINYGRSACILFTNQIYALSTILPASPEFVVAGKSIASHCATNSDQVRSLLWAHVESSVCRTDMCCTMKTSQNIMKGTQSSRNVGPEPRGLTLVNEDLDVRAYFEQVRCMEFCRKILGFNVKLAEHFSLSFNGFHAVITGVTFQVIEETLSATTNIPQRGERWSKGIPLDSLCYDEFIKPDYLNGIVEASVPSRYLQEPF
jgi:hypothetical protein